MNREADARTPRHIYLRATPTSPATLKTKAAGVVAAGLAYALKPFLVLYIAGVAIGEMTRRA